MSIACLYLGGKVEDSPKSVRDVLAASCDRHYKDAARRIANDRVRGGAGRLRGGQGGIVRDWRTWPCLPGWLGIAHQLLSRTGSRGAGRLVRMSMPAVQRTLPFLSTCIGRHGHPPISTYPFPWISCPGQQDQYEAMKEKVFVAERSLLYALDFDFNVQQPLKVGLQPG